MTAMTWIGILFIIAIGAIAAWVMMGEMENDLPNPYDDYDNGTIS